MIVIQAHHASLSCGTSLFAAPCYIAFGRHLKVPVVATVTNAFHDWLNEVSGNPANPAFVPSIFSHGQRMDFKERLTNFFLTHYLSWHMHYYTNHQLTFVKEHFGMDVPHIKDLYNDIALYLVNSHHTLNGIRPMTTNVIEVGGLHLRDDDKSPSAVRIDESCFSHCYSQYILSGYNK
ncbi:PREDICTED: uncharacterized protein LOC105562268 [Vollenhovia emeryi]|uniref:uncharacterized protein LOC105562268 n=1 Tax=Vollenhovia emeryi TaxID=411798 RepID=UPI0005F4967E|nr:PREDICTED: uncharacterized protein LOC105562268 [Vollenhovia emeryi]